jgi:hypothetical protein
MSNLIDREANLDKARAFFPQLPGVGSIPFRLGEWTQVFKHCVEFSLNFRILLLVPPMHNTSVTPRNE